MSGDEHPAPPPEAGIYVHGGSLRIFGCHDDDAAKPDTDRATEMLAREDAAGYSELATTSTTTIASRRTSATSSRR